MPASPPQPLTRIPLPPTLPTPPRLQLAANFAGFESEMCGLVEYMWAVGTEPFGTDIMAFTTWGIVATKPGTGHAQGQFALRDGAKYHISVRVVTGCGVRLQTTTAGVTADITQPDMEYVGAGWGDYPSFQTEDGLLNAVWKGYDWHTPLQSYTFGVGTAPGVYDVVKAAKLSART